jgi:GxxExxY protein
MVGALHLTIRMLWDDGTGGVSETTIGAAIDVHRQFGPGLLERAYHLPLLWALEQRGLAVEIDRPLSIEYAGRVVERAYVMDLVVDRRLLVEVKSVAAILPIHLAQVSTYLSLSGLRVGLIVNFNVQILRHGIKRILHPDLPRGPRR